MTPILNSVTVQDIIEITRFIGTVMTYIVLGVVTKFYYQIKSDIQQTEENIKQYVDSCYTRKDVFNMHLKTLHNGKRFGSED